MCAAHSFSAENWLIILESLVARSSSQSARRACPQASAPFQSAPPTPPTQQQQQQDPPTSMAAADSRRPASADDAADKKQQEEAAEARKVHEVTDSSSDESGDEAPSRTRSSTSNSSQQDSLGAETATVEEEEEEDKATEMPAPDVVERMRAGVYMPDPEVLYNTKNVADMHYLFTNDKLKEESPAIVLRSDPFCIPRVTDNVPNYRPMLNPLSIFLGEDQLLPGNFRLDPTERLPNAGAKAASAKDATNATRGLPPPPGSSSSSTSSGKQLRGKTSAFMGTMPRQTEFAEIPVSEKLFQNHEVFRPLPPIPRVPASPSRDERSATGMKNSSTGSKQITTSSSESDQASTSSPTGTSSRTSSAPASLSDAMLLSSIQHTLDATTATFTATDSTIPSLDSAADSAPSTSEGSSTSSGYEIQPLQPLESVADTLTNYLPSRSPSITPDNSRPMDGQYLNAPGGYNPVGVPMGYTTVNAAVPGTFGSLLSLAESQASTPYSGLFVDSAGAQSANHSMQTFSSALGSISLTTPTNGAAGIHSGLITPQGGAARPSEGAPRHLGAKKPRAKNMFRPCASPGCTKGARGKSGLCQKHGGGKRCATPNCPKGAQGSSTMCLFHGGGYRCTVEGCTTGARGTSGLCAKHGGYKKGKAGATGKRGPNADGAAAKRVRTDEPQHPPAPVKVE
ncbi:hypothetical protein PHYPSEUDO_003774 [Phytophthora pseudosyringae]|uniref:Uncharacterized protein n=1 Tax=Phytophthora pseudosyringae TaxID=221518 RepID=A0A8T1WHW7_9STRA|nr:hypothetical protein PHYPSEUDO_003774 [Phytophthora pseudosyringae]